MCRILTVCIRMHALDRAAASGWQEYLLTGVVVFHHHSVAVFPFTPLVFPKP